MRTLTAALTTEKNKLSTTSAWLPLLTVEVNAAVTLRLVPNPTNVVFNGLTYTAFGLEIEEISQDAKGGLADVAISVSNVTREISAYIEANDLRGARVTLRYVNSANLADPLAVAIEENYEVMSILVKGAQFVTFTLGHERISSHQLPSGRYLRDNCRWIYKDPNCTYAGPLPTCDKILEGPNGCRVHSNQAQFGGFPLLPSLGGRL